MKPCTCHKRNGEWLCRLEAWQVAVPNDLIDQGQIEAAVRAYDTIICGKQLQAEREQEEKP